MEEEARRKDIEVKLGPSRSFVLLACNAHCSRDCLLAGGRGTNLSATRTLKAPAFRPCSCRSWNPNRSARAWASPRRARRTLKKYVIKPHRPAG